MDTIEIKLYKYSLDEEWDDAIKKALNEADLKFTCKDPEFGGKKAYGVEVCVYELKNEGVVVYEKSMGRADIHFLGFNPKSWVYIKLKNKLNKIANTPLKAKWED